MKPFLIVFVIITAAALDAHAADWKQFRGNEANGISRETSVPTALSGEKIAWIAELPGRGLSGPIVVDNKVIVTCSSGFRQDRLHAICIDEKSGKPLWERQFWATGRTMCHNKMCVATPTPASDGKRVFAFYSSNDVACLDLKGNLLWYRGLASDFPNASNSLGMASSPVVVGDVLIVQVESDAEAFTVGLNAQDGTTRWKIDRVQRANWTSPTLLSTSDPEQTRVVLQSSEGIDVVHPQTGVVEWSYHKGASTIPSSTSADGILYVPSNGLTAVTRPPDGKTAKVLWQSAKLSPATASPLSYDGHVFTLNRAGVLTAAAADSGEVTWQLRLRGPYSSTPVIGAGHLFAFNEKGFAQIVNLQGGKGKVVSELDFAETILCTPAIANGALFVRSDGHLWKVGP